MSLKEHLLRYLKSGIKNQPLLVPAYLTLRSVSSLNNPQNSEIKIWENMLKIIIIIIGYTPNNFTTHITIL
jgi:hypothetical protein